MVVFRYLVSNLVSKRILVDKMQEYFFNSQKNIGKLNHVSFRNPTPCPLPISASISNKILFVWVGEGDSHAQK